MQNAYKGVLFILYNSWNKNEVNMRFIYWIKLRVSLMLKKKINNKIYLAKLSISWIFEFSY